MAYFEKRPACWRAQVRRRGAPSISRTFDTKAQAMRWAAAIERELQGGNLAILAKPLTFNQVAEDYARQGLPRLKSHKTALGFLERARAKFGATFITSIQAAQVSAWREEMLAAGTSPRSTLYALAILSSCFTFAERELQIQLPAGNPLRMIKKPTLPRGRDRRLRPGDMDALLAAAATSSGPELGQMIVLAVETSMRLGEILGLEWNRIDLDARTAHLDKTKNGDSRTVALSSAAITALLQLRPQASPTGRVIERWSSDSAVGRAWSRTKAQAVTTHHAMCAATGTQPDPSFLANLRFHDLRHEATSRLFERGLGIMEVASMTGHKSLSMLKRYTHLDAARLAQKLV